MALGVFKRLVGGLTKTRAGLKSTLQAVVRSPRIDEEALEELEASLLAADLGPALTDQIVEAVRERAGQGASGVHEAVRGVLREALPEQAPVARRASTGPHVVFVVGVNGGGKTTTVGKLAAKERAAGRSAIVVAADTFRAAAIEQLARWAERAEVTLIKHRDGADPSAVVFDGLKSAKAQQIDTVLVDTAGRLHTKTNLMAELAKLARVAEREIPGAPHEVLLVVDATTGQNGLNQAEQFTQATRLTGVVLTKLDGTAKGGVALGIHQRLGVAVQYVGVGETVDDLLEFDADAFVDGLIGEGADERG